APHLDHFGLQVETLADLHAIVDRAKQFAEHDAHVEIIDVRDRTTHGPTHDYALTSAYRGFVLPLMIELQHLTRLERARATNSRTGGAVPRRAASSSRSTATASSAYAATTTIPCRGDTRAARLAGSRRGTTRPVVSTTRVCTVPTPPGTSCSPI